MHHPDYSTRERLWEKLTTIMIVALYSLLLLATALYSFVLVDPNLTLVNHPLWSHFREAVVQIGYHQRDLSFAMYLTLIALLFFFNRHFTTHFKKYEPLKIAGLVSLALLMSYPFLSHDFFNYLFDARILTYHHLNPYTHMALDFPEDPWVRFMHWTHRTYNYGPTWLMFSLIPSFLGVGKFVLNFIFFKTMFVVAYMVAVYSLSKINKRSALFFATHPLVLIEGLVNAHNDLIALSLALFGVYLLHRGRRLLPRIFFLLSGGIKYITLPLIVLSSPQENKSLSTQKGTLVALLGITVLIGYLTFFLVIQPWYFLAVFVALPYFPQAISKLQLFFVGLLLSYYPYIALGGWVKAEYVEIKLTIIIASVVLTLLQLIAHTRPRLRL